MCVQTAVIIQKISISLSKFINSIYTINLIKRFPFLTLRNQLIRKQNDLRLFLNTIAASESQEQDEELLQEVIQDDLIEFDKEIEIFDDNNELLSKTENFMNEDDLINEKQAQ